jgi:hypothetical protein
MADPDVDLGSHIIRHDEANRFKALHALHPYPGTLARHIPYFLLRDCLPQLGLKPQSTICDPFCGAGSVLTEGVRFGHNFVGFDVNPLACLISRAKGSSVKLGIVVRQCQTVVDEAKNCESPTIPNVVNIDYWYKVEAAADLAALSNAIVRRDPTASRDVLLVALSKTAMEFSLSNPRFPVPVKIRPDRYPADSDIKKLLQRKLEWILTTNIFARFSENVETMTRLIQEFHSNLSCNSVTIDIKEADVRTTDWTPSGQFDAIITSPPYPGAQKYSRFSSLSLGWLQEVEPKDLAGLERMLVGREHFAKDAYLMKDPLQSGVITADRILERVRESNPLRAHIGAKYLEEMQTILEALFTVTRPGGFLVLVSGASTFTGLNFDTPSYLSELAQRSGFSSAKVFVDPIRTRRMITRRKGGATAIPNEVVEIFKRPNDK